MFEMIKRQLAEATFKFLNDEKGAETLEWVAITAVVIIIGTAAYTATAPGGINGVITAALDAITAAVNGAAGGAGA